MSGNAIERHRIPLDVAYRHPAERTGRPWYLRSFTKSPMRVAYPMPMGGAALVVYWARWADATGDFSLFSKTCVARVEGWTPHTQRVEALPMQMPERYSISTQERVETKLLMVHAPYLLPEGCDGDDETARKIEGLLGVERRERLMLEGASAYSDE